MAEYIDRKKYMKDKYNCDLIQIDNVELVPLYQIIDKLEQSIEREKIDKAIEEIEQTLYVDSLIFGELIDFKNRKISADDVIEEFNRVTRKEVLEILKRNIGVE